jgi:hypothetical protein
MPAKSRNIAASVRQRLLNIATSTGEDFGLVLTRYALERLLYRLSQSNHRDQFILKGAMLFQVWTHTAHRPTRDLDLLGRGDPSIERCQEVFGELCRIPVEDDGLTFSAESVRGEKIKARAFPFQADDLSAALRATFERRKTRLDPDGLSVLIDELSSDVAKRTQWRAFLGKSRLTAPADFALINSAIREFLLSVVGAASAECQASSSRPPGGPWQN